MTKLEVDVVARYCAIASTDKLIEALAFSLINQTAANTIEAELERRLQSHNSDTTFR